jgi:hypothetical protein
MRDRQMQKMKPREYIIIKLQEAMRLLSELDDSITERGGDEDSAGRKDLHKIRLASDCIEKALRKGGEPDYEPRKPRPAAPPRSSHT